MRRASVWWNGPQSSCREKRSDRLVGSVSIQAVWQQARGPGAINNEAAPVSEVSQMFESHGLFDKPGYKAVIDAVRAALAK